MKEMAQKVGKNAQKMRKINAAAWILEAILAKILADLTVKRVKKWQALRR